MSSILVVSPRSARITVQRKTLSQRIHIGMVTLSVILIVIIATVLVAYLMASNVNATKGYEIKSIRQEQDKLQRSSQDLNLRISDSSSLHVITNDRLSALSTMQLPSGNEIVFVDRSDVKVAKK